MNVSIAIPAHNEQETIKELLSQLLHQECKGFTLHEIIVLSDNSTDDTVMRAKSVDDARIKVIETPEHMGQNRCQNTLFRMAEGDIVVFLEADMIPHSVHYLTELVTPIVNGEVACTYGATEPWLTNTGVGSLFYFVESAKVLAYRSHKKGRNIFTCHSGKAMRKDRVLNINWPPDVAEDAYFYLFARYTLRSVHYAHRAILYYHVPASIGDYLRESMRFSTSKRTLSQYFSYRTIRKEYSFTTPIAFEFMSTLLKKPHYFIAYVMLVSLARFLSLFIAAHAPTWKTAPTTKIKFKTL